MSGAAVTRSHLAGSMHRFSSRSDESADLTRRATEAPANVLYGTLRRPIECNAGRADDFVAAVEDLCIIRASIWQAPRPDMEYNQDTETSISWDWKGLSGVGCKVHPDSQGGDLEWAPLHNLKPILGREERT